MKQKQINVNDIMVIFDCEKKEIAFIKEGELYHTIPYAEVGVSAIEQKEVITKAYNPDSIEIGTPAKGGACKVYGDYADRESFELKIKAALELRGKYGSGNNE